MWTAESWYREGREAAEAGAEWLRAIADYVLESYMQKLPNLTREQIGTTLAESNRRRIDAVPGLVRYPELRGMRELILARWRGTREGAGLDDVQAAVNADGQFYMHRHIFAGVGEAHCSVVFFPTSDHGPLVGVNLDSGADQPFGAPDWPAANEHLLVGGVSSGVYDDEETPEIFPAPVFDLVARYCRNTDEAVEMLTRYNHFWGPCNLLVADRDRHTAMIEKTACRIGVRRSSDGFGFVTAMTAEHPEMNAYLADRRAASLVSRGLPDPCDDTRYWALQDQRRAIMTRLLEEARRESTLEKMRALMQYRGPDGFVCDNGDVLHPGGPPIEFTLRTTIVCLAEGRALWWARDSETGSPSWENPMPDVKFDNVLLWD